MNRAQKGIIKMGDYLPRKDLDFQKWLDNFLVVANANLAVLGMKQEDLDSLNRSHRDLATTLDEVDQTRTAYLHATQQKEQIRNIANSEARSVVRRIQANSNVPTTLKAEMNVTVREARLPQPPPTAPTRLVAVGFDNGQHDLRWQRGENTLATQYVIEAKTSDSRQWSKVDVVTATKYQHAGQPPGVKIIYRVLARRSGKLSPPSNEFTLYEESI